jgi:hypothetical protein
VLRKKYEKGVERVGVKIKKLGEKKGERKVREFKGKEHKP